MSSLRRLLDGVRRVRHGSPFLDDADAHRRWIAARAVSDGVVTTVHVTAARLPAARRNHALAEGASD